MVPLLTQKDTPEDIKRLLWLFEVANGVIDYVLFQLPNPLTASNYDLHFQAAVSTLEALRKHWPLTSISIDPTRAVGRSITIKEFLGPQYDPQKGYQQCTEMDKGEPAYTYAFFDPPYSLSSALAKCGWAESELFFEMNKALINNFEGLSICQWSTEWSSYIDQCNEWWGAYLWTVENPARNLLIGVAASTTD